MRRMLSGLSVIAVLAFAIGTGGMHPAAAQNKPQDRSTRNPEEAGKPSATPARSKSPAVVVNHPPPRNGAYYKGIFRN